MTPVHSVGKVSQVVDAIIVPSKRTKSDEDEICRPRNSACGGLSVVCGEVDGSADNASRVTHG